MKAVHWIELINEEFKAANNKKKKKNEYQTQTEKQISILNSYYYLIG